MRTLAIGLLLLPVAAMAQPAAPPPQAAIENVTVEANKIQQEKGIHDYIAHSAKPSQFIGKIARWRQPICPETQGFLDSLSESITRRVREIAAKIGAPVDQKPHCKPNVMIYFTRQPQALMDELVAKRGDEMLGFHFVAQTRVLATITHPIQAWYATGTRDADGRLNLDTSDNPVLEICATNFRDTPPALQAAVAKACGFAVEGNRGTIRDGMRVEMGRVTIIGDSSKLDAYDTDTLADYAAMLALTQVSAFEDCQDMPSITNLLAPGCRATNVSKSLSEVDLAYLRALYHTDPALSLQVQQSAIEHEMLAAFKQ